MHLQQLIQSYRAKATLLTCYYVTISSWISIFCDKIVRNKRELIIMQARRVETVKMVTSYDAVTRTWSRRGIIRENASH